MAGESIYIAIDSLPISTHRLRIKKLIEIDEVNPIELLKSTEKKKTTEIVVEKTDEIKKETPLSDKKDKNYSNKKILILNNTDFNH